MIPVKSRAIHISHTSHIYNRPIVHWIYGCRLRLPRLTSASGPPPTSSSSLVTHLELQLPYHSSLDLQINSVWVLFFWIGLSSFLFRYCVDFYLFIWTMCVLYLVCGFYFILYFIICALGFIFFNKR